MHIREHARNFEEIFATLHRRCYVPAAVADKICSAVCQRLLDLGLKEADLSVGGPEAIWAWAYSYREPVTHEGADVLIDRGGYRIGGAPVLRIAVRRQEGYVALGAEIFSVFMEHGIPPTVLDVVGGEDEMGRKVFASFVFVLIPQ